MPIAFAAASDMGVSALPMVMSVAMGASASFLTPFANGVSLMVYGPGGYKFGDFWRLGLVVLIWTLIVTVIVTPLYWPFTQQSRAGEAGHRLMERKPALEEHRGPYQHAPMRTTTSGDTGNIRYLIRHVEHANYSSA
jgi:Na+/H+ antiporter NhaD/arsenite permease-like protein